MQIEVNEIEYCRLAVNYEVGSDVIASKENEVLKGLRKAKVSGFRPGKASNQALKVKFKSQINDQVKQLLAQEAYYNTLSTKNIKVIGQPQFTSLNLNEGKFSCSFLLLKKPDFDLKEYRDFELPKPATRIEPQDLAARILEELRYKYGSTVAFAEGEVVERTDSVVLDYTGAVNGEEKEELSAKNELVQLGRSNFPEFEDNLLGMTVGETRTFEISPLPSHIAHFGESGTFTVTVLAASKVVPAGLDDALAQKCEFASFADLKNDVDNLALSRTREYLLNDLTHQVSARLVQNHDFAVPDWLVTSEAKSQANQAKREWDSLSDEEKETFLSVGEKSVKLSLVLEKVRENEPDAQLSDEELVTEMRAKLSSVTAGASSEDVDNALRQLSANGVLPVLMGRMRDEHTLKFVTQTCKITE